MLRHQFARVKDGSASLSPTALVLLVGSEWFERLDTAGRSDNERGDGASAGHEPSGPRHVSGAGRGARGAAVPVRVTALPGPPPSAQGHP